MNVFLPFYISLFILFFGQSQSHLDFFLFKTKKTSNQTNQLANYYLSIMFTIRIKVKNFNLILLLSLIIPINIPMYLCQNMICQRIPNLTAQQLQICQKSPEILSVIRKGIQVALFECQQLFSNRVQLHPAWNCSSWIQNSLNRLYVNITDIDVKGTKEASFAHALFAAAVVYTLSEACTRSSFPHCSCGPPRKDYHIDEIVSKEDNVVASNIISNQEWKWNGCVHNIQFGLETARIFLDSSEHQMMSPYSLVNLHNNNVGRKVVRDGLVFRCQCHGFSGTCTFRTCWYMVRGFRQATQLIYYRYTKAKMVSFSWLNKSFRQKYEKRIRKTKKLNQLKHLQKAFMNITLFKLNQPNPNRMGELNAKASKRDLIYLKPSINHCQRTKESSSRIITEENIQYSISNQSLSCLANNNINNETQQQWPPIEPCDKLCCGAGYREKTFVKLNKCECVFQFCCSVVCKSCPTLTIKYECITKNYIFDDNKTERRKNNTDDDASMERIRNN